MSDIRRILVALDASPHSLAALEAACGLARRLEAELLGLYVEDINLVRLAAHPCATTFSLACPPGRPMGDDDILTRALRLQGAAARRALDEAAARARVTARFSQRQGRVEAEVLAAAEEADLLVVGWTGRAIVPARSRAGSVARAVARDARASVLVLQRDLAEGGPVMLLYDGSEAAERALAVAMTLARRDGGEVAVLLLAETPRRATELERSVESRLSAAGLSGRYQMLPKADAALIRRAVGLVPGGVLVAGVGMPALAQGGAESLLDDLGCSVVLVK